MVGTLTEDWPVKSSLFKTVQVYFVPVGTGLGWILNVSPLQIVETIGEICGLGLIVTEIVNDDPLHVTELPEEGVTVYTIVWAVADKFVNVCVYKLTGVFCELKPLILLLGLTVQVYFVPDGTILPPVFVKFISTVSPLQIILFKDTICGFGFTVTFNLNGSPLQPFAAGVTS